MDEKLIKPYRINNIEFRPTVGIFKQETYYEIVKWCENTFYGKDDEYEKTQFGNLRHKEYGYFISESCLKNKETCFTLATFENTNEEEPNLRSVGKRPFELTAKEHNDFISVVHYGFDEMKKKYNERYE